MRAQFNLWKTENPRNGVTSKWKIKIQDAAENWIACPPNIAQGVDLMSCDRAQDQPEFFYMNSFRGVATALDLVCAAVPNLQKGPPSVPNVSNSTQQHRDIKSGHGTNWTCLIKGRTTTLPPRCSHGYLRTWSWFRRTGQSKRWAPCAIVHT